MLPSSAHRDLKRALVACAFSLWVLLVAARAHAHTIGLSTGEYTRRGASLVVKLAFARAEIAALVPDLDANHDGHVSPAELEAGRLRLERAVLGRVVVTSVGRACTPKLTDAGLIEQDGLLLSGRFDCASADDPIDVDLELASALPNGHKHVARSIVGDGGSSVHDEVIDREHRRWSLAAAAPTPAASSGTAAPSTSASSAHGFFWMGLEHILTGYDHLLFLLALVLVPTRLRPLLAVITAFTVAHSVTLALGVLHVVTPPSRFIEPAIALSIVYVAVENLFVEDGNKRWRITFPFGLVHGFGFAGALEEVALPRAEVPAALGLFNLGVEVGQLAVLAVLLPIVFVARKRSWLDGRGVQLASMAIAFVGGAWFVARVVSATR